jgi:hypothetical protein
MSVSIFVTSAQLIQEQQAANEDREWNPEVDVSGDHSKEIQRKGTFGWG